MAELDDLGGRLSVLARVFRGDGPPPRAELERRLQQRRGRRRAITGLGGVAAAVAVVAGAVALTGGTPGETTVRMAAPTGTRGDASVSSPAAAPPGGPIVVDVFTVAERRWELLAVSPAPATVCLFLRTTGREEQRAGCWDEPVRAAEGVAVDVDSFTYVTGVLSKDVISIAFRPDEVQSRIHDVGLPVNLFGAPVRPAVDALTALVTLRNGTQHDVAFTLPAHGRVASVDGEPVRPATTAPTRPTTTAAATTPLPTRPPTRPPTGPADPAPTTTVPPSTGRPQRVEVVPGATNLRKQVFESAVPFGAQSVLVTFWDGIEPCSVLGRVDVAEGGPAVTITIWTGSGPGAENQACIAIAQQKETVVALGAPLGDRVVPDGAR